LKRHRLVAFGINKNQGECTIVDRGMQTIDVIFS